MNYNCGAEVLLEDEIMVEYGPGKEALARVVAIGTDVVIDGIDEESYSWLKSQGIINKGTVVVEWITTNPLAHNDPHYAPVGNYMTLESLCCERFVRRGGQQGNG